MKPPAFQFYPKDYMSDEHVQLMSLAQEGTYLRLLCHQWLEGSVPDDVGALARLCRVSRGVMVKLWPGVHECFPALEGQAGRLANPRMERDRQRLTAFKEERSLAGKRGAESRWKDGSATKESLAKHGIASATATATNGNNGQETAIVVATVPASPDSDNADGRFLACFNGVFGRNLRPTPKITQGVRTKLRGGYKPWQLVALPILVDAQGVPTDMRRTLAAEVLLRDGKHPRTGENGRTYGATDWLERALGRMDQTTLDARQAEIAKVFEVLEPMMVAGVMIRQDSGL